METSIYTCRSFFTNTLSSFKVFKDKIKNKIKNRNVNKSDNQKNKYQTIINNNTIIINNIMDTSFHNSQINHNDDDISHSPNPKHKHKDIHINKQNHVFNDNEIINYSKYGTNIVSSVIHNMIDTIQYNENLVSKYKNKSYTQQIVDFYNTQLNYSLLKPMFDSVIYDEFCNIISNILNENTAFLINLKMLKQYTNDLIKPYIRYGVFKTKNFVIKIDDSTDIFNPELEIMYSLSHKISYNHNIVIPQYIYFVPPEKNNTMNFSIQPLIKNSLPLHKWMRSHVYRQTPVENYIKMCISVSKSILYMHSNDIVHGDIKPDNILIDIDTNTPYIIDFGLSGVHGISCGTGGTKPFCCPETKNINDTIDTYIWTKNNKQYDLWSIAFIFASIIIFKNVYNNYCEYPVNYFNSNKYISLSYLYRIPIKYRDIFILVLSKKTEIDLSNFIQLLEEAMQS